MQKEREEEGVWLGESSIARDMKIEECDVAGQKKEETAMDMEMEESYVNGRKKGKPEMGDPWGKKWSTSQRGRKVTGKYKRKPF